ncbi:MAG: ATP-binding protein [Cellulosilyticaceae bacterium]
MQELALHILDLVQNSVRAEATVISIKVEEDTRKNQVIFAIDDNGKGMEESFVQRLTDPFTTTRTLRKVGLGIPFVAQMCRECEGDLVIESQKGIGTNIKATMRHDHIDRLPLGSMAKTLTTLIMAKPTIHYVYTYTYNEEIFELDTKKIQEVLGEVPINDYEILEWLQAFIEEGTQQARQEGNR